MENKGCMCMECKYREAIRNNHEDLLSICVCRESENYLHQIEIAFDDCDFGVVDDWGEDEELETLEDIQARDEAVSV